MPYLLITLSFIFSLNTWETDFEKAKQTARTEHKMILLNFSGSDWCGPCIRLHDEIFEQPVFKEYAESNLILVNADFPRLKKNKLSKDQQRKNDQLADTYNKEGSFPLTLLLNADGKVIMKWDGIPQETVTEFIKKIKSADHAN